MKNEHTREGSREMAADIMATSTTELTHSIRLARLVCSCFIKNAHNLASLGAGDEVRRMTMLAASMQFEKDKKLTKSNNDKERKLANEESQKNEFQVRRTLVHRAIKKLRQEERNKHRQLLSQILKPHVPDDPHNVMGEIMRLKNVFTGEDAVPEEMSSSDDDDPKKPFVPTTISFFDVVKKTVAVANVSRTLHKKTARPSWYSEYQEAYNYEHRVQKDGFQYIFEYRAHFGNTIKSFFPTCVMAKNRVHSGSQCAFISLDKTGFNYWEVYSSENKKNLTMDWDPPKTKKRIPFKRRQNEFIQALCWHSNLQLYIGAGLDMMAHIYDRQLNYIVALPTAERVIR